MKAQQSPRSTLILTHNAMLFAVLTMGFLPALHAQSNQPVTGSMVQSPMTASPVAPRPTYAAPSQPVAPPQAASIPATPVAPPAAVSQESAPAPVAEQAIPRTRVGDVTQTLLQAQTDGRVAGPRLPMLGVAAEASWQRYLDSFRHPLPEFFENKVAKSTSN